MSSPLWPFKYASNWAMPLLEYKPAIRSYTFPSADILAIRPPWSASIMHNFSLVASSTSSRDGTGSGRSASAAARLLASYLASASPFSPAAFSSFRRRHSSCRRSVCAHAMIGLSASINSASRSRSGRVASAKTADLRLAGSSNTTTNKLTGSRQLDRGITSTFRAIAAAHTARDRRAARSKGVCVACDSASTQSRKTVGSTSAGNSGSVD